jgi:hypothetical protein
LINGRKGSIVTDTLGLLRCVVVLSAGVQDRDGAKGGDGFTYGIFYATETVRAREIEHRPRPPLGRRPQGGTETGEPLHQKLAFPGMWIPWCDNESQFEWCAAMIRPSNLLPVGRWTRRSARDDDHADCVSSAMAAKQHVVRDTRRPPDRRRPARQVIRRESCVR